MATTLFLGGCGGGRGLQERVPVEGLAFPLRAPTMTPYQTAEVFPQWRFVEPVFMTASGGATDSLFVVERRGIVYRITRDSQPAMREVVVDLTDSVSLEGPEDGMMGLALHPNFQDNGYLFLSYSSHSPYEFVVRRFRLSNTISSADIDAALTVFSLPQQESYRLHKGGMLQFGPDGMLYIAFGDGGPQGDPQNNAQNLSSLRGKVLRIDPSVEEAPEEPYVIPDGNPFLQVGGSIRAEIWAYGFRHPWRFSFDPQGRMWLGDVGWRSWEEINIVEKGRNYGWRMLEGKHEAVNPDKQVPKNHAPPIWEYPHSLDTGSSVIGGYVYRGTSVPALSGKYVYGDFTSGRVWALEGVEDALVMQQEIAQVPLLSSFAEDSNGELYLLQFDSGKLLTLQEKQTGSTKGDQIPSLLSQTGLFSDLEKLEPIPGLIEYSVQVPLWSDGAKKRRWMAIPGMETIDFSPGWDMVVSRGNCSCQTFRIADGTGQVP